PAPLMRSPGRGRTAVDGFGIVPFTPDEAWDRSGGPTPVPFLGVELRSELADVRLRPEAADRAARGRVDGYAALSLPVDGVDERLHDEACLCEREIHRGAGLLALLDQRLRLERAAVAVHLDLPGQARSLRRLNGARDHLITARDDH